MFAAFNFTWPKVVVDIFAVASVATFSPELTAPGACVPACATKTPNTRWHAPTHHDTMTLSR